MVKGWAHRLKEGSTKKLPRCGWDTVEFVCQERMGGLCRPWGPVVSIKVNELKSLLGVVWFKS